MMRFDPMASAARIAMLLLVAMTLVSSASGYEHRRGTPSVGAQLQYGDLRGDSEWGDVFARDIGGAIHLRQYVARNRAWGITFELQKFQRGAQVAKGVGLTDADEFQYQTLMGDYYLYFRRLHKQCPYLVASAGFYHPQLVYKYKDEQGNRYEEVEYPSDGFIGRIGAGMEYFINRTLAIDGSVSAYYVAHSGGSGQTVSGQAALGIHLYVGN